MHRLCARRCCRVETVLATYGFTGDNTIGEAAEERDGEALEQKLVRQLSNTPRLGKPMGM